MTLSRDEAYRLAHTGQAMTHQAAADDADAEAATFHLMAALHGDDDTRAASAGHGGPELGACGGAVTVKQRIATIIAEDPQLNR